MSIIFNTRREDMPQELKITLIVIASIIGVWLLLLAVNLIFVGSYLTIFKKHRKAMVVILYTKLENMKRLFAIVRQSGVEVDNRLVVLLNDIREVDFDNPESQACEKSRNTLSYLKDEVLFLVNRNNDLQNDVDFIQVKNNINESDMQYRNNVTMYNADVLGYNYWIRFAPCRFIFKMFKVKKKDIIS